MDLKEGNRWYEGRQDSIEVRRRGESSREGDRKSDTLSQLIYT